MCGFISWIEKGAGQNKQVLFLTADDLKSKRGKELEEHCQRSEDWIGHGAIRWFYDFKGGKEREVTDFSSPSRFPREVVAAILQGKFKGMAPFPKGLLTAPLYADYQAKRAPLYADYQAKRAPLYADYQAKTAPLYADYEAKRDALYADYEAKRAALYADYQAKRAPLYADYEAKRAPLDADYEAKRVPLYADYEAKRAALGSLYWDMLADPANRADAWRDL